MKVVTKEELVSILQKHSAFLNGVAGGVRADLYGADLRGADLRDSDLRGADLSFSDLRGADLRGADLYGADLRDSDLYVADLHRANLHGADLCGANLSGTTLDEKEQLRKGVILKKELTGYKKLADGSICVLSIPKGAIVFSINGSACRTNKAKVLDGGGVSKYDSNFSYEKGKRYFIDDFDLEYNVECTSGIHFFKTRKEAEDYN